MGLHEKNKDNFNELEHETAHCMHEKLDLLYLSEISFSLRYMNIPSVSCVSGAKLDMRLLD